MEEYPTQRAEFEFHLQIDPVYEGPEGIETVSATSFAPVLQGFDSGNVDLIIGEAWEVTLNPFDENDDLAFVLVDAGRAGVFVNWDES